jgi:hypothetical protein
MIKVGEIDAMEKIPKKELLSRLEKEAPDFLAALIHLEIPPSNDRLNVPVINTTDKLEAEKSNRSPFEAFLEEFCYHVPGKMMTVAELHSAFTATLTPEMAQKFSKIEMNRQLPPHFPKGRNPKNSQFSIGNISLEPFNPAVDPQGVVLVLEGEKLVPKSRV